MLPARSPVSVRPGRRRVGAALAVALGLVLAGCTEAPHPSPSATALPHGITATLVQLRGDVATRQAQVSIHNGADDTLLLGKVHVEDARFSGTAERVIDRESKVAPGRTVNVRVQLPAMDCSAPSEGTPLAEMEFTLGAAESVARMRIEDTLEFLPDLHRRECLNDALAEVAEVSLASFTPAPPGQTATMRLDVRPTGTGSAELVAVQATPLLMYAVGGRAMPHPLAVMISPDARPVTVDVPLAPQRCDPHVVQEDKRGTVFTVDVVVDGVAGQIDLAAAAEMKAELLTWVAQWCGFGSG